MRNFTAGKGGKTAVKSVISGLLVAFSMYSAIPVPQVNWEKQTMRWALGFLPLIGVLIGAIEWFWFAFCVHFGAAGVFYAVIAALIPLIPYYIYVMKKWSRGKKETAA